MNPIEFLSHGLKPFSMGLPTVHPLSDLTEIVRARQQVQREHDSAGVAADPRTIMTAIAGFRRTGEVEGFRGLKYVCLGVGVIDAKGWCVLGDGKLRRRVSDLVEEQEELRRRLRCFQALLSSFWTFAANDKATSEEARTGWLELRSWLRMEFAKLAKSGMPMPQWFETLGRHAELLTNQPCDKFGADLLKGDSSKLNDAMEGLAIPKTSWVLEEAVFAQMSAAVALSDETFKKVMPKLVPIALGRGGVELGEALRIRCVAELVARYAKCNDRPEDMALRDAAVATIGNPWLRRANWDAWVVDSRSRPDNQAREMINGWLKRRLISDFFELLSVDGTGDPRRLDYWLRFEPVIEDMWFALGSEAQYRRGEQFDDFRSRAKGRLLDLEGTTADNNAFVMRIGEYLAVEFGAKGNAFFLFKWANLDSRLMKTLTSGQARAGVSLFNLKARNHESRLIHMDSARQTWEMKFDDEICPLIGHKPKSLPYKGGRKSAKTISGVMTNAAWNFFVKDNDLSVQDHRSDGGALWVYGMDHPTEVERQLKAWNFAPRSPRGWFRV